MKYEKEYKQSKNRNEFIKLCKQNYENILEKTFIRRYYDFGKERKPKNKLYDKNKWKSNNVDYEKIFKYVKNSKEFADRVINLQPLMKLSSARRRYYDVKKKLKLKYDKEKLCLLPDEVKQENIYMNDEKERPSCLKMIQLKDMKRMCNKKINKNFLRRYGFNTLEINWLEDEGEIDGR